ncbi:kinase-like domain-containing protein [Fomes fomentarius]|nr:kinase-like domain-containing protein [Fomes fomentarius]
MPSAALMLPNLAGLVFHKRYQFLTMLGSGSYGVVYKAIDLKGTPGDRERAIKLVSKRDCKPSLFESFRREMAIHKRASMHPNVITLHDAYEDAQWFVFVMDCCRGGDLATYLDTHGPYRDETKLRNAFLTLVDTVDWLHSEKIYHRDLKPQNILVSEDGTQLFIADFGLASEDTTYHHPCGTPGYMPPGELHEGRYFRSGAQSDTWALGLIFVVMLSAKMPWRRATLNNLVYLEFLENPRFMLESLPISQGTNRIIRRMLRANTRIRARLPQVRVWVTEIESFYRTVDDNARQDIGAGEAGTCAVEMMRSTLASENKILNLSWAPNTRARQLEREQRLAGPAVTSTGSSSARSTPTSFFTPDGSVVVFKDTSKKDIGERVKSVILRLVRVRQVRG